MGRIRTPFISGTILNNPLAVGGTTLSGAGLAGLPTIASPDIAVCVLDYMGSAGAPEVTYITAHTAAATTATISRAAEGSTARQHLVGVPFLVGPTSLDFGWTSTPATQTAYNPLDPWWEPALASMVATVGGSTGTANTAYGIPMRPLASDATLVTIAINITAQSGNIDVGLYMWDGTTMTRIVSLGTTACPATGQYEANITDTIVYKGLRYYTWVAADNAVAAFTRASSYANPVPRVALPNYSKAASFPLPATLTTLTGSLSGVIAYGNFA